MTAVQRRIPRPPVLDLMERMLASRPEVMREHRAFAGSPETFSIEGGRWSGVVLLYGRANWVMAVHVPRGVAPPSMLVGRKPRTPVQDRSGLVRLLDRCKVDDGVVDAWIDGAGSWKYATGDLATEEEVLAAGRGGARMAASPGLNLAIATLERHRILEAVATVLDDDQVALLTGVLPGTGHFTILDGKVLALLAGLPNPRWVARAVAEAPFLRRLLFDTSGEHDPRHLRGLAEGRPVLSVVGDLAAGLYPRHVSGFASTPASTRSVSRISMSDPLVGSAVACLVAFHAANPAHRSFDAVEVGALVTSLRHAGAAFGIDMARDLAWVGADACANVVRSCLDRQGRLSPLPVGYRDAAVSLRRSIQAIDQAMLGQSSHGFAARAACRAIFTEGRRLSAHVRIDRAWHDPRARPEATVERIRDRVMARIGGEDALGEFPHLVRVPTRVGTVTITPLLNRDAYLREGEEMLHCIGGHHHGARLGSTLGYSLVGDDGSRSSASFVVVTSTGRANLSEHKGVGNSEAPGGHRAALMSFASHVSRDRDAAARLSDQARRLKPFVGDDGLVPAMDDDERRDFIDAHFANVAFWLTASQAKAGPEAWWREARRVHALDPRIVEASRVATLGSRLAATLLDVVAWVGSMSRRR